MFFPQHKPYDDSTSSQLELQFKTNDWNASTGYESEHGYVPRLPRAFTYCVLRANKERRASAVKPLSVLSEHWEHVGLSSELVIFTQLLSYRGRDCYLCRGSSISCVGYRPTRRTLVSFRCRPIKHRTGRNVVGGVIGSEWRSSVDSDRLLCDTTTTMTTMALKASSTSREVFSCSGNQATEWSDDN